MSMYMYLCPIYVLIKCKCALSVFTILSLAIPSPGTQYLYSICIQVYDQNEVHDVMRKNQSHGSTVLDRDFTRELLPVVGS